MPELKIKHNSRFGKSDSRILMTWFQAKIGLHVECCCWTSGLSPIVFNGSYIRIAPVTVCHLNTMAAAGDQHTTRGIGKQAVSS